MINTRKVRFLLYFLTLFLLGATSLLFSGKNSLAAGENNQNISEPDRIYKISVIPSDKYYNKQWYLERIRAPLAWDKIRETPNVIIAVIDTGVQIEHPDLKANIWVNTKEIPGNGIDDDHNGYIDDVNGWDFVSNIADPSPKYDDGYNESGLMHGTVVAGIIAAVGNNTLGVSGVTWNAKIMPLRALDSTGEGNTSDVVKAIDYAINNGAKIINLSFVGLDFSQSLDDAIRRAENAGVIIVAAAGNEQSEGEGYNLDVTPMYPACDFGVIGVAATDSVDQKASFSSYGAHCVSVSAPGVSFYGTLVFDPSKKIGNSLLNQPYGGFWSGTSMASPVVAGVLALIEGANPSLSTKEVKDVLLASSDNIDRLNPLYVGKLGQGRVNAFNAVNLAQSFLNDRKKEIILSAFSNFSSQVKEVNEDGSLIKSFNAYNDNIKSGLFLASGDVDNDKKDEIIIGAGVGRSPEIKIFSNDGVLEKSFLAYDKNFKGGVRVAVGDINGDGKKEIVVSPGNGLSAEIRSFDQSGNLLGKFLAYDKNFKGGANIAVGDIDGDGYDEIVAGAGTGGGPQVRIFDSRGRVEGQFLAFDKNFRGGVNINAGDINSDGYDEIVTGAGVTGGPHVRVFDSKGVMLDSFYGLESSFTGGINVGVITINN